MTTKTVDRQWCLLVISKPAASEGFGVVEYIDKSLNCFLSSPLYLQGLNEFLIPV